MSSASKELGIEIVKESQRIFWGGYSPYFQDLNGRLSEIAFNLSLQWTRLEVAGRDNSARDDEHQENPSAEKNYGHLRRGSGVDCSVEKSQLEGIKKLRR